jgi:predicted nuclease of predicted toxin-antitoxin system
VKLLLDENLSDRIIPKILDLYPDSSHVKAHNLISTDDATIWTFARTEGFTIVSKDSDFHQRALLYGAPPKFIFLPIGNCSTDRIVHLLRQALYLMRTFHNEDKTAMLVLSLPSTARDDVGGID